MDFSDLPVMQMMTRKMSWLSKRTDLLAENVANVDMPGWPAPDHRSNCCERIRTV
jgi:flagellar basal-body rod protein FlgB